MKLHSPLTGNLLHPDTPYSLAAAGERWPVVDGIAYLRIGRADRVATALDHLDSGRPDDALVALLADQDDWWTGPAADPADLRQLVQQRDTLTLREAMTLLRMGPVADYFAHRWSDPTYLAGLALLEAHWNEPETAFELACGIGHYLRDLNARGVACIGADVVFSKCWLARHWIAPDADYIVFDAAGGSPLADSRFDLVMCHDAFYFLPQQDRVADMLRSLTGARGILAISHLHNADFQGGSKGPGRSVDQWGALFPGALVYDERVLHRALLLADVPKAEGWIADDAVEAWSLVEGGGALRSLVGGLAMPPPGAKLAPNPLLGEQAGPEHVRWPSERYRDEYAGGCWWALADKDLPFPVDPVRLRRLVDLPERW